MLASARVSVAECIAGVAQSVAHLSCKQVVEGSSPFSSSLGIDVIPVIVSVTSDQPSRQPSLACQARNTVQRTLPSSAHSHPQSLLPLLTLSVRTRAWVRCGGSPGGPALGRAW